MPETDDRVTHVILRFYKRQIFVLCMSNIGDMVRARHDDLPQIEEQNPEDGLGQPVLLIAILEDLAHVGDEADSGDV